MKLFPLKGGHGHITAYRATLGSLEAREAGFLNEDGTSKILRKTADAKNHRIIIELDEPEATEAE